MDVKDCISAINNLIDLKLIDKNKISLLGGSHGGFLVNAEIKLFWINFLIMIYFYWSGSSFDWSISKHEL